MGDSQLRKPMWVLHLNVDAHLHVRFGQGLNLQHTVFAVTVKGKLPEIDHERTKQEPDPMYGCLAVN